MAQKIYVVEDDDNLRAIVCYALDTAGFETGGFAEPSAFWPALEASKPALIVLDIMLPGEDGISILKKLKAAEQTKNLPVIMLTAKGTESDRIKGLDLGADDYVTKPFSVMELISRVKAVLRRCGADKTRELRAGAIAISAEKRTASVDGQEIALTYTEFELLHCLIRNMGLVLSRDKLMEMVWGIDVDLESRTIDMHIKALRRKLGHAGEQIKTVRSIGYKLEAAV